MLLRGYRQSVGVPKIIFLLLFLLLTSSNFIQIHIYPRLNTTLLKSLDVESSRACLHGQSTLKCLHDKCYPPTRITLSACQDHLRWRAIFSACKRSPQGHPSRRAFSVDLKTHANAPYKRGDYFRRVYSSKASTVEEDLSKSSDDETRVSRELDIDDIQAVCVTTRNAPWVNLCNSSFSFCLDRVNISWVCGI